MSRHRSTQSVWLSQAADLVLLTALCMLALLGLRSTYGGTAYLIAGAAGVATGLLVGAAGAALTVPALGVAAATVVAYFVVGLAVPGPRSVAGLLELAGHGWKQLLTTLPPIGGSGPLPGLPFLLGLAAATLGSSLALRTRPSFGPLFAPAA